MASQGNVLSDDEVLLDLLRLIVTRHPSAMTAIGEAYRMNPHLAKRFLTFTFSENASSYERECRCHYDHEYMTYITESGINSDLFGKVAKNVINGYCCHTKKSDSPATPSTPVFNSEQNLKNIRRSSVDFDIDNNSGRTVKRLISRRSGSLKSLDSVENVRATKGLRSRRASNSWKSLWLDIEEAVGETQTSLVHAAAAVGNGALLQFLLKWSNLNLLQIGKFQLSPLHLAIVKNQMDYMRNIILCCDVYLANPAGVFCYACATNGEMDGDSKLNIVKLSIIGLCIKFGDLDTLSALMNNGGFRDQIIQRGLREAIDENSTDGVELLFKNGARPDLDTMKIASTKSVSVFEAVFRKFRKDFKIYALQHPEHIVRELVMPAILTRNTGIVKVLIQNGAPVNCKGFYTPLAMAVLENQPEVTQILLESHVDRNMELQGCNLLDIAICMGYTEVADVLRKFGFKRKNKSPKDIVPCSLLIGIASKLDLVTDVMKLRRQIEMKHHAHNDDTVLHVALKTRLSRALIGELLKMGSDVNAKNKKQETPLMCAVSKESGVETDVIREILYYNPVLEQCDKSGKTTLALAIANDQSEKEKNRREEQTTKSKGSCANVNVNESIAPLLLDCGYNVKYDYVKKPHHTVYALRAVWKDLAATIGCGRYGLAIQDNPKLLQIRCREILRRSNPGIHLHRFLERMKVPSDISDFVLMTSVLKGQ